MIGGQALIEGILMRGPRKQAIVVRSPEGLVEKVEELKLPKDRYPALGWPLIRGVVNFFSSMLNGVKALTFSADFFPEYEEEPTAFEKWIAKKFGQDALDKLIVPLGVVLGILFAVGLFMLLPTFLVGLIPYIKEHLLLRNLLEGVVKVAIFVAYIVLVSRMKEIKRVFSYHGAEHKTIRCYEAKLPLTVENVRPMTRLHPRCGTSFLFVVIILSVFVGGLIQTTNTLLRMLFKLLLLPVVVALAYECNRFAGAHDNWFTRILTAPGMWFQNFTTNEPDDGMIEVAIRAMELVIPEEEGADQW
ncbi:MAG: DUF1385 domain-containing protein [Oscillospiraceae bacterium]|nr:DUF1385 domain-containing protein [Oscillospiraceae bacterium]